MQCNATQCTEPHQAQTQGTSDIPDSYTRTHACTMTHTPVQSKDCTQPHRHSASSDPPGSRGVSAYGYRHPNVHPYYYTSKGPGSEPLQCRVTVARDPWQLQVGGPFKPISHTPPPLIGLSGLGPPNDLTHKFQESYLKRTMPPPSGKGAASTSSNHLPHSRARGLPLFNAP